MKAGGHVVASRQRQQERQDQEQQLAARRSPLLFDAICDRNWGLAEGLIEERQGLDFVSVVHSSNTVLHAAVLHNAPTELVQKLLLYGQVDVNKRNKIGRTPVYLAARHNVDVATMKLLIASGGAINQIDDYQYTPLMAASYNGASLSLVACLVGLGANLKAKDHSGKKADDWALEGHHDTLIPFLQNISVIPVLCAAYIDRVGSKSLLRMLPREMMRLVREMLAVPSSTPKKKQTS